MRLRLRRTTGATLPALLVTALVLFGAIALSPTAEFTALRGVLGLGQERLGEAPDVPRGEGQFRFTQTQPGSDEPVGYNPCRPIRIEVNPEGAPPGADELIDTSIRRTAAATGLQIEVVGETTDRDFARRHDGRLTRARPVLLAWAAEDEMPELEGDIAGVAGSTAVEVGPRRLGYVTGVVVLDASAFAAFAADPIGQNYGQAILDHEFGHLVGLIHVSSRRELMHGENVGVTSYGAGDREGLARLGGIDCW